MSKTFSQEVREAIVEVYNGFCCVPGCNNRAQELHHAFHNTILNNKKYPLFMQSIFNARPVCKGCHEFYSKNKVVLELSENLVKAYEAYLKGEIK